MRSCSANLRYNKASCCWSKQHMQAALITNADSGTTDRRYEAAAADGKIDVGHR